MHGDDGMTLSALARCYAGSTIARHWHVPELVQQVRSRPVCWLTLAKKASHGQSTRSSSFPLCLALPALTLLPAACSVPQGRCLVPNRRRGQYCGQGHPRPVAHCLPAGVLWGGRRRAAGAVEGSIASAGTGPRQKTSSKRFGANLGNDPFRRGHKCRAPLLMQLPASLHPSANSHAREHDLNSTMMCMPCVFLSAMQELGLTGEMGSGYPGDATTVAWLKANLHPVLGLPHIARFSWETCAR